MRRYLLPRAITSGSVVKMPSTHSGARMATNESKRAPDTLIERHKPSMPWMRGMSFCPQYWAANIAVPLVMPKNNSVAIKKNWLAIPTAATALSPSCPIIRTSTNPREDLINSWTTIGLANRIIVERNFLSLNRDAIIGSSPIENEQRCGCSQSIILSGTDVSSSKFGYYYSRHLASKYADLA